MFPVTRILVLTSGLTICGAALGQTRSQVYGDQLTKQSQTLYMRADIQATTYESDVVQSKQSFETTTYSVGAWTGEGRQVGIQISSADTVTDFSLNDSTVQSAMRDIKLMARMGWFVPSIGASLTELDVTAGEEKTFGIYSTGVTGGLQIAVPITLEMVVSAEGSVTVPTKTYDKLGNDTKMGNRTDGDINASYDLTERALDLLVGYRLRSQGLKSGTENLQEKTQGAYAGIRFGLYF